MGRVFYDKNGECEFIFVYADGEADLFILQKGKPGSRVDFKMIKGSDN